jgi:putative transposase
VGAGHDEHVAEAMTRLVAQRGRPAAIKVDNGSEFAGKVMDRWAYENGVELDFSRRGTPTDNALVESFNGRLRQECLNEHWFLSLGDARSKIEAWRPIYNEERPTLHWHGKPRWNSPEDTGPKRIPRCRRRPKSLLADGPGIGGGSPLH